MVTGLMNSANNRDFYSLNQMIVPLIESKNVEFLDSVCALHWCCFSGHIDLVNRLLDVGCDPFLPDPINYESPVYYAIKSSNAHIISILLKRFGPLILCHENRKCKTPFLVAVSEFTEGDIPAVLHVLEFLYLSGVSLEEQDSNGATALMFACKRGELFVVQWLLKKGADLSHRDHFGATVLHYAVLGSSVGVLIYLIKNGVSYMATTKSLTNDNTNGTVIEQNPLDLCKEKVCHLSYYLLKFCWLQTKLFGRVLTFYTIYPVFYWLISISNFFLFFPMWNTVYALKPEKNGLFYSWLVTYFIAQIMWIMMIVRDPGVSTKQKDYKSDPSTPSSYQNLKPFEAVLNSLHKRKQMVNFEFYYINRDLKRQFFKNPENKDIFASRYSKCSLSEDLLEPLNEEEDLENPFMSRLNTCNEEINNITTEMRSIYPQIANERCMKNTLEYNDSVLNFENSKNVCLTCSKTRSMREHHCSICNLCVIHQDHHCAWVDSCVGSGNQRLFFSFVTLTGYSFLHYFFLFILYFSTKSVSSIRLFDFLMFVFVLFGDGFMLFFVIYLWIRTWRTMLTDVTYYEYLKKPAHVRLKLNGNVHEKLWDFKGLSLSQMFRNLRKYWTYKTKHYEVETSDSFVGPESS